MPAVGFLHTAEVHVSTFSALLREVAPGVDDVHLVDGDLLAAAQRAGVDRALRERLCRRLRGVARHPVDVVVCTCSTLGASAEALTALVRVPVLRVDRPMAEAAVASGRRIAVVAALPSTLAPTRQLLEESAAAARSTVAVQDAPCRDAWELFEAGDRNAYFERVAETVRELAGRGDSDVIVLAQASMAPAAARLADVAIPVFSSPRLAVQRAAALAAA